MLDEIHPLPEVFPLLRTLADRQRVTVRTDECHCRRRDTPEDGPRNRSARNGSGTVESPRYRCASCDLRKARAAIEDQCLPRHDVRPFDEVENAFGHGIRGRRKS